MAELISFSIADVEKIGLTCPNCNSEIVISQTQDAMGLRRCPVCLEVENQPPFVYGNDQTTWPMMISRLKHNKEAKAVRLYFKKKEE